MGFLSEQRSKWRARHHSARHSEDAPLPVDEVSLEYSGGPLGLTLQRSKSKYVDEIGPTKIVWHKDRPLGLTLSERDDGSIYIKELSDAASHAAVCIGQELIGVQGKPIAGLELSTVMDVIRSCNSPCELAFTPPPSPILVAEASAWAVERGVTSGHVLVSVNGVSMLGSTLQQASKEIEGATPWSPAVLHFAPLHIVFHGQNATPSSYSRPQSTGAVKKSLRNTLCIAAVAAALTV